MAGDAPVKPEEEVALDLTMFWNAALGAAGGGGVVGALVLATYQYHLHREQEEREEERRERIGLAEKLARLENDKLQKLEEKLDLHLEQSRPGEVALEFRHINGTLARLSDKLDKVADDVAALKAESGENRSFAHNLYDSVQKFREEVYHGR